MMVHSKITKHLKGQLKIVVTRAKQCYKSRALSWWCTNDVYTAEMGEELTECKVGDTDISNEGLSSKDEESTK